MTASERSEIEDLIKKSGNSRWMLFIETSRKRLIGDDKLNKLPEFSEVYIQQLPRKAIRELSRRWCIQTGIDVEKTFRTIMKQLQTAALPRTGFTVTLLLWSVYQKQRHGKINEAILLNGVIDILLGKTDLKSIMGRDIDPKAREITLQYLSVFLRGTDGITNINDATEFLIEFFRERGLRYAAHDVLDVFINSGILSRIGDDIAFKYPCFQDLFRCVAFERRSTRAS